MHLILILMPILLAATVGLVIFKPYIKGYIGEKNVSLFLNTLPGEYTVLNNIMLKTDYGTTQIDHIVISCYGIFVIETKNYKGWIYGSDDSEKWTQVLYKQKNQFMNPLRQNYKHYKAVEQLIKDNKINIISIVAFSGNATLKVNTQNHVVYFHQLRKVIKSYNTPTISNEACAKIKDMILHNNIEDKTLRKEHVTLITNRVHNDSIKVKNNICPKCNAQLRQRRGRYGYFLGCSNFPKCKYISKEVK